MGKKEETGKKRSQRDYGMSFKMSVIVQIEKGDLTYQQAQDLYGISAKAPFWFG